MPVYQPNLQIGVGHDAMTLTAIEAITPSGDRPFLPVRSYGTYDIGDRRTRLNGRPYFAGVSSVQFISEVMTIAQFKYLKTTYCAGGYSGLVTINVRLDDPATYAEYDATLILPKENELEYNLGVFVGVIWSFIDLEINP